MEAPLSSSHHPQRQQRKKEKRAFPPARVVVVLAVTVLIVVALLPFEALNHHALVKNVVLLRSSLETTEEAESGLPLHSPRPMEDNHRLIYVRLQKTGSKTLRFLLQRENWLMGEGRPGCQRPNWLGEKYPDKCRDEVARQIAGVGSDRRTCAIEHHCDFSSLVRPLGAAGRVARVITQLREPTARVLSEFRHVCGSQRGAWDYSTRAFRSQWTDRGGKEACRNVSAAMAFIEDEGHGNGMRNRMTRLLAGAEVYHDPSLPAEELSPDIDDAEMLAAAKRNLDGMDGILLLEQFDLSLVLMSHHFQVAPPSKYLVVREPTEAAVQLPPADDVEGLLLPRIRSLNRLDLELYAHAEGRLRQWAEQLFGGVVPQCAAHYACRDDAERVSMNYMNYYSETTCHRDVSCL